MEPSAPERARKLSVELKLRAQKAKCYECESWPESTGIGIFKRDLIEMSLEFPLPLCQEELREWDVVSGRHKSGKARLWHCPVSQISVFPRFNFCVRENNFKKSSH